jgi:hypothetical protein
MGDPEVWRKLGHMLRCSTSSSALGPAYATRPTVTAGPADGTACGVFTQTAHSVAWLGGCRDGGLPRLH